MDQTPESLTHNAKLRLLHEPATSCEACGACCRLTPVPPFAVGESEQREVPEEWLSNVRERLATGQQFDLRPCVWYDSIRDNCRHYEYRPTACRDFTVGSVECTIARRRVAT